MTAFGQQLLARAEQDSPALLYEDSSWSYRQLVDEGWRRARLLGELLDPARPPHVGVLLDNVPDYVFWLTAGALSGAVIVGINSTYRGEQLAQLIDHTDCQVIVTDHDLASLLADAPHDVAPDKVVLVDDPDVRGAPRRRRSPCPRGRSGTRRRRPVPAHLHVRFDGDAQGGALHPGPHRPHRDARRLDRRAHGRRRRLRTTALLPRRVAVHRVGLVRQRRRPDRDAQALLDVGHDARHPPVRGDDDHLHGQGPELHPLGARAARRRHRAPPAGHRERGVRARHPRRSPAASPARCATATAPPRA